MTVPGDAAAFADFNFRRLGTCDVSAIKARCVLFGDAEWKAFTFRQSAYAVHAETSTIPVIFNQDFRSRAPTKWPIYADFQWLFPAILKPIDTALGKGYVVRAIFTRLPAGKEIPVHTDFGESLANCHRVHVPIISNPEVRFTVGDETVVMGEGEFWVINNSGKQHSVSNQGPEDRVHLIIDWLTV